jgi:hypothetical protein
VPGPLPAPIHDGKNGSLESGESEQFAGGPAPEFRSIACARAGREGTPSSQSTGKKRLRSRSSANIAGTEKNRLKGLLRLVRLAIFLIIVALILFGAKAAHDWFDQNFAYGALKPGPYPHVYFIGTCDETTLPDGRRVQTRYKGKLPSFYQLPPVSTSKIGDMWYTEKDDPYWALEPVSTMSSMVGWIDP